MEDRFKPRAWIVIVIVLSFGVTVIAGKNGLLSARCVARCLTEHRDSLRGGTDKHSNRDLINKCNSVSECRVCTKPCNILVDELDHGLCEKYCGMNERECKISCRFLMAANARKAGDCPSPESAVKFEAACLTSCHQDGGCPDHRKCCPNKCGTSCREPLYTNYHLPPIPSNISFEERRQGRALKLTWQSSSEFLSEQDVFLYLLQNRNTTNQKPTWKNSPWQTVLLTQQSSVLLREIHAGHWYQYRIAAVSQDGNQGFSQLSSPFKSSRSIEKPQAPQNLTEGATTLKNRHVDVMIHWEPPKYSDLPIWKYTVIWNEQLTRARPVLVRIDVLEKSVPGHQLSFKLRNLKPGTTYKVDVEATVQHGNKRLKSKKSSMTLMTYSPPKPNREDNPFASEYPVYADLIKVQKLEVQEPYFHLGFLKTLLTWKIPKAFRGFVKSYMIFWEPQSCDQNYASMEELSATTHDMKFEVYDLLFECQYVVKVNAVTQSGVEGKQTVVKFRTPLCQNIQIKGDSLKPECPQRVPQPPKSPHAVIPHTEQVNCSIQIKLSWKPPISDLPIESYVIEYGVARVFRNVDRALVQPEYRKEPIQIVVANSTKEFVLPNLKDSKHYVIKLAALSEAGLGDPAFVEIWTPSAVPCASEKDPEPTDRPRETTFVSTSVKQSTEGSTSVSTTMISQPVATVPVTMTTTNVTIHRSSENANKSSKDSIYKAVAYLFFVIGRMISRSFG